MPDTRKALSRAARGFLMALIFGIASLAVEPGFWRGCLRLWVVAICAEATLSLMLAEAKQDYGWALLKHARLSVGRYP